MRLPVVDPEDFSARMENAASLLAALLAENKVLPLSLGGLGIGLPASVRYPLHRKSANHAFGRQSGWPRVSVNINADLGALAHANRRTVPGARKYLYIDVSSTITAGFAIDGRTYSNIDHVVGDIGHTVVEEGGWLCECGERGCLNTLASTRAIMSQLRDLGVAADSEAAIFEDSFMENPTVSRVLQRAGLASGEVIARIALFLGRRQS
ncbi:hypothetical protein DQ354_19145 [Arthrobacter sp. AQ5-06]|nr:hypothetical protein DQ354_19145 [Arthrobacter sp. AQ5-06]